MYEPLVESSDNLSEVQKQTISANVIGPITYLQYVKNNPDQFKIQTGTALTYDQYYELRLLSATTHDKKLKRNTKFGSKSQRSVYELEQFPN